MTVDHYILIASLALFGLGGWLIWDGLRRER